MSFEEDDFNRVYEYLDWATNTEGALNEGIDEIYVRAQFGLLRPVLVVIEAMVRDIEFDKHSVGFNVETNSRGKTIVSPKSKSPTLKYHRYLGTFLRNYAYANRHVYSPHVQAVVEALDAIGLRPYAFCLGEPGARDNNSGKTYGEIFNDIVAKVVETVESTAFRERLRVRKRNAARNEARGLAIEEQVFENKSRRLVLMLHLGINEQHRSTIVLEEFQRYRKTFFNNCRTNKLLRGIVDYVWKLEEGDESGLHLHLLIFYTADSCRDIAIAKMIGEYWLKVTNGKGQYWNSNAQRAMHAKYGHGIGTGEINWNEDEKRDALRKNIQYMTKADQFLKRKYGKSHAFGTSQVREKKKAGRPRMVKPEGVSDLSQ